MDISGPVVTRFDFSQYVKSKEMSGDTDRPTNSLGTRSCLVIHFAQKRKGGREGRRKGMEEDVYHLSRILSRPAMIRHRV